MRSKEITTIESLNSHITNGWKLIRAFENNRLVKYLIAKNDMEVNKCDKRSKNNC